MRISCLVVVAFATSVDTSTVRVIEDVSYIKRVNGVLTTFQQNYAPSYLEKLNDVLTSLRRTYFEEEVGVLPRFVANIRSSLPDAQTFSLRKGLPIYTAYVNFEQYRHEPTYERVLIIFALVGLAILNACFNGLTLGLLSLDVMSLEIIANGSADEKKAEYARRILPLRRMGNLLLSTLLLGNSLTMAVFSILLADVASPAVSIVISVTVLYLFCDIIPNSTCHRYSLQIGARMIWLCWIFIVIFFPICYPTGKFLDWIFGDDIGTIHSRKELVQMLGIYIEKGALDKETADVMRGALSSQDAKITEVMTPSSRTYMLSGSRKLDLATIAEIFRSGKSRIP
eukprot:gene77-127_t